jgi:hypothetical protein
MFNTTNLGQINLTHMYLEQIEFFECSAIKKIKKLVVLGDIA